MNIHFGRFLAMALAFALQSQLVSGQQSSDPQFNTTVAHPTYTKNYPRVVFDEAHNNFHTTTGRYKPFIDLIGSDGYNVVRPETSARHPDTFKILVIAKPSAPKIWMRTARTVRFTEEECDVVRDW